MSGVDATWVGLGEQLGFDGLLDDLAVIVDEGKLRVPMRTNGELLVERVREVVDALGRVGHEHAAVAVVAANLSHEWGDRIFEAGAMIIEVPGDFFGLDADRRRAFLLSQLPASDAAYSTVPAPAFRNVDAHADRYDAPNPDLSEDDIIHWRKSLGGEAEVY